jgi:ABC-type sugar transport system ATPase subunit
MHAKIAVNDIRKSFATDKGPLQVIAGIDFAIADGELYHRPFGCGRTTLLNASSRDSIVPIRARDRR